MYRAILPDGDMHCARYDQADHGVDLYDGDDDHLAFVPYGSLVVLIDEETYEPDDSVI